MPEGMHEGTLLDALRYTLHVAGEIRVPVEHMEEIGFPLLTVQRNLTMICQKLEEAEQISVTQAAEAGKPSETDPDPAEQPAK